MVEVSAASERPLRDLREARAVAAGHRPKAVGSVEVLRAALRVASAEEREAVEAKATCIEIEGLTDCTGEATWMPFITEALRGGTSPCKEDHDRRKPSDFHFWIRHMAFSWYFPFKNRCFRAC